MPRSTRKARKTATKPAGKSGSAGRAIWKGSISFGLVNIPVALYAAEQSRALDFDLLDRRDFAPVGYRRVNKRTGREVGWAEIVKGYQYRKGEYVALSDEDFRRANVEASQTIDIADFVDGAEISPMYFDKPYYLVPLKNGRRAYALLREVLSKSGKVAIAKVVIRSRQHLAAVIPQSDLLILNLLRFQHELRDSSALDVAGGSGRERDIGPAEIKMAERLIEAMSGPWKPAKYRDEYREDLLQMIDKKVKSGQTKAVTDAKAPAPKTGGKVVDIMDLLRRSVEDAKKSESPPRRRKAG